MILPASYSNGFSPRDGQPLYPSLWTGCVGAWNPGLGPTGLTLRDWSGFGRNGTLTNMEPSSDWTPSLGKYALDFATDDYVSVPFIYSPMPFSVSLWAFSRNATTNQAVFSIGASGSANPFFVINFRGDLSGDPVVAQMRGNDALSNTWATFTGYSINTWYHITAEFISASSRQVFVNAVQGTADTTTHTIETLNQTAIGCLNRTTPGVFHNGGIDDVRLYSRLLSQKEKQALSSRRGIAYELAPRRRSRAVVITSGFSALRPSILRGSR